MHGNDYAVKSFNVGGALFSNHFDTAFKYVICSARFILILNFTAKELDERNLSN